MENELIIGWHRLLQVTENKGNIYVLFKVNDVRAYKFTSLSKVELILQFTGNFEKLDIMICSPFKIIWL